MGAPFRGVSVHVGTHAVPMCCSAPADYKCACIDVSYSNNTSRNIATTATTRLHHVLYSN